MDLGEYILGLLSAEETQEIERYLATHPEAQREVEQLRAYIEDWNPYPLPDASDPEPTPTLMESIRTLIARLRPPALMPSPPMYVLRGESDHGTLNELLIYEIEGIEITIGVQPEAHGHFALVGSVSNTDYTDLKAYLYVGDRAIAEVAVDELGDFYFADLSTGRYLLILDGPLFNLRCDPEIEVQHDDVR